MVLSLNDFSTYLNWKGATIHHFSMAGNSIHMDVHFKSFHQPERCKLKTGNIDLKTHLVFKNVSLFTDAYFSNTDKLFSRFQDIYTCQNNKFSEKGEFIVDDCLCIICDEVEISELIG